MSLSIKKLCYNKKGLSTLETHNNKENKNNESRKISKQSCTLYL